MSQEIKDVVNGCRDEMSHAIDHLEKELSRIRAGKANPKMLEDIKVDYYGTPTPLSQVANIKVMDARTLLVQPWEKAIIVPIEQSIQAANLGINPQNDGESVILSVPMLTEERRLSLVKQTKAEGEQAKIGLRAARKTAMDAIKALKDGGVSEDLIKDGEAEVQKVTDEFAKKVDDYVARKDKEIMTV